MYNALIIDDNYTTAETHKDVLDVLNVTVTVCDTPAKGVRFLKNSPCFDLILCDLNFPPSPKARANTEGMTVGEFLKDNHYPAWSLVSSAKYDDGDLAFKQALEFFDGSLPPGAPVTAYQGAVQEAIKVKLSRIEKSSLRAEPRLAQDNERALLTVHKLSKIETSPSFADQVSQGFKVLVVQPETHGFPVGLPFFVWLKDLDGGVFLEVYGQPQLLAYSDNLELALATLNEVLFTSYLEVMQGPLSPELKRVKQFLKKVYESGISTAGDWKAAE